MPSRSLLPARIRGLLCALAAGTAFLLLASCGGADAPVAPAARPAGSPFAAPLAPLDMRHMRGVHATSNFGTNEAGFRKPVFGAPLPIAAERVRVQLSRSSGPAGTWDLAAVRLEGVALGGGRLATAGFWLSRNAGTGEISLAFNPSMDTSLAGVPGFAGDLNLPRNAQGSSVDLGQMARATGTARELVVAVVNGADALLAGASYEVAGGTPALDRAGVIASMAAMKAGIQAAEGARDAYFAFLRGMNVEWIGLTVPVFNDSIADPVVRVKYRPAGDTSSTVYTFADEDLEDFLNAARAAGFKLALGFEFYPVILDVSAASPGCGTPAYKPNRWLLGQPVVAPGEPDAACIKPADWWWNPAHPSHAANVATFWNSYTQVLVKYAKMAQRTGVDLFLLATEQDNLFRTRAGPAPYTNHFRNELTQLVAAVRAEFAGRVSFEQLWTTIAHPEWMAGGGGTAGVFASTFADLGLDFVAVSAYFPLVNAPAAAPVPLAQLESAWDEVFRLHLRPLQDRNPGKPIVFTEWGYTNDVNAPYVQGSRLGAAEPAGPTAGTTQQSNILQAFFNANARNGGLVQGSFLWGVNFQDPADCTHVTFGVYCKPAAATLTSAYAAWQLADAGRVFDWAERVFPQLFPAPGAAGSIAGYDFRYYAATGTYLAVKDGRIVLHDGARWNLQDVGPLRGFLDMAAAQGF